MAKQTTIPEVKNALKVADQLGVEEYHDRRANPAPPRPDYVIEGDPVLAEGDPRVESRTPVTDSTVVIARDADPVSRLAATMEKFMERQQGPSPVDPVLASMLAGMMETMKQLVQTQAHSGTAIAEATRKANDPSNMFAPDASVFNPRGERDHPRPRLRCKMFLPWEAEWESLTREEIELLNLLEPGKFIIKRNDESRVEVEIKVSSNPNTGSYDRLLFIADTALNNDYHWLMPPMRAWLRQILSQRPSTKMAAARVMTSEDELDLIRQHGVDFEKVLAMREEASVG